MKMTRRPAVSYEIGIDVDSPYPYLYRAGEGPVINPSKVSAALCAKCGL
jgi:hypothetical protein